MALKIIEAHVPGGLAEEARETLSKLTNQTWIEEGGHFGKIVRAVIGAERSGIALDRLHEQIADRGGLFVLIEPLDAVLPRPHASNSGKRHQSLHTAAAVSREEVYASVADGAKLHRDYPLSRDPRGHRRRGRSLP